MKTTKDILVIIVMLFTIVAAVLLLLTVFEVTNSDETRRAIMKIAEACGIIAIASAILLGLSSIVKNK